MSLRDVLLKPAYDSDEDDILSDFYIPMLSNSVSYRRLAGFFSSSALAVAARGISGLIKNGGTMKLVVGAKLRKADVEAIEKGMKNREQAIADMMIQDLDSIEAEFVRDHVRALAWMVANNKLEIKIAVPLDAHETAGDINEGIYHQKVGILSDGGNPPNSISFSGSVNESETGWLHSIEEFKVFRQWVDGEDTYVKSDIEKFEKYWNGLAKRAIVIDIPTAVRDKLIELAPESVDKLHLERHYRIGGEKRLWPHQAEAIRAWVKKGHKGIMAMATGTGKTLAALAASNLAPRSMITLILVPTDTILRQWVEKDIPSFDKSAEIICCSGDFKWRDLLPSRLAEIRRVGKNWSPSSRLYVVAMMKTASSEGFLLFWKGISEENIQVICDEVHHLGAPTYQRCTEIPSSRRLGLSATPERYWDPEGTLKTVEYIGPTIYEYSLKDAIRNGWLSHYQYFPHFAFLDRSEFDEFYRLTEEITKESSKLNQKTKKEPSQVETIELPASATFETSTRLERLCEERARIKKKAKDKIRIFREIMDSDSTRPLIVFCEDDEQLVGVRSILQDKALSFGIYTSKRTDTWQREKVLESFRNGEVEILLAIRCLDEGLDVPECRGCIIIASSSSTREFVQRRGRILRALKEKVAILNDIIVLPPKGLDTVETNVAETLVRQELERMLQLIDVADNWAEARNIVRLELKPYGMGGLANL